MEMFLLTNAHTCCWRTARILLVSSQAHSKTDQRSIYTVQFLLLRNLYGNTNCCSDPRMRINIYVSMAMERLQTLDIIFFIYIHCNG